MVALLHLPGDRVHQVGLAQADAAVEEQRVEGDLAALGDALGHPAGRGVGELIRLADDEVLEGAAPVDRRGRQLEIRNDRAAGRGAGAGAGAAALDGATANSSRLTGIPSLHMSARMASP